MYNEKIYFNTNGITTKANEVKEDFGPKVSSSKDGVLAEDVFFLADAEASGGHYLSYWGSGLPVLRLDKQE